MSLSTTYAFDPGASYSAILDQIGENPPLSFAGTSFPTPGATLIPRQLQITTTITPTITRGATQAAVPTRTEPRARPLPSAAAATTSSTEKDDSLFPANLSWWQILGIAIAGVALLGIVAYIFISRRNKARLAEVKAKEAEVEEGRKAKDQDDIMPRGMGMGGLGMGMGGMGMGMGMGGMPMMYGQNDGGGGGGRRGKRGKKRYDSSDSESESDGGTIRPSRRKGRRKYGRRGGRRKDDYSSDETLSSAASSTYYARPSKSRHRNEKDDKRYRDRRRQESSKTPISKDDDYPLGLGPPTTGLPTSSTRKSPGRKGSLKRFQDSVFSTFDSMTNKAAKLEELRNQAIRNQAIEAKQLENEIKLRKALKVEAELEEQKLRREIESDQQRQREMEKQRQAKVIEANAKIKAEEKAQKMIQLYPSPPPPARQDTYESQTPLIPPVSRSRSNDSSHHSPDRQPDRTKHVGRHQRLRENLAPASTYNSALPDFQAHIPLKSKAKRSSSDLPYAYDGVTSVMSSQPPPAADTRRPPGLEGRKTSSRNIRPPAHRQDSDQPLKSAMRAPGDRKPRRKATITEKPPTTRMITDPRSYDSGGQDDWLPKPPVISKMRAPKQSSSDSSSREDTVYVDILHPSKRPNIKKGDLAPAPKHRSKSKPSTSAEIRPPAGRQETSSGAAGVGAGARLGAGSGDRQGQGGWLGWKGSGGMGNVDVTLPSQSKALNPTPPQQREVSNPRPTMDRAGTSSMSDPHQPGKRWANRLREKR